MIIIERTVFELKILKNKSKLNLFQSTWSYKKKCSINTRLSKTKKNLPGFCGDL